MKTRNRAVIGHLIDTLKFMGQLGIPFRGHRDSGRLEPVSDIKDIDTSTGNFRAILQLHSMGNSEIAAHLKESPSNATYLSPDIQNELITLIGEEILSSISSEVKDASCFAVIADETTDKSIKSQLSIVVRYLKGDSLTERCIGMINQSNLKGKAIADTILSHLKSLNLPLEKMIGQGYDGASSMSGKEKGVQAIVKESCPLAVYVHCSAHVLNLVLVKSCAIPEMHSTFDFIGDIASFFKSSSKRNARLTTAIKRMSDRISNKWRLQQPCQTRWAEKHSAVLAVSELYDPIRQVLLELSDLPEEPTESRRKATSLYSVMTSSKFCIALCILEHVMAHTSILSQLLQKVDIDLRTAVDCVNNLQSLMKSCRDVGNNDTYDEIYQKAADMVSPEEISMPRIVKHQTMRSNVPAESPKNYYLRNLYYPFLDSVILQLDQRFSGHAKAVMRLSSLLPANVVTANFCEVEPAVNLFLPLLQAPLIKVKAQFLLWQRFCQNHSDVVVWKRAYKLCQPDIFPAIKILLSILATLPVSSATAERSFSTLRLIKSDLRTTMGQARLDGLCLMYIHNDISISTGAIVKKFAATSRKIKL